MKALPRDKSPDSKDIEITEKLLVAVNGLLKHFYSMPKSPALRQCVNALLFTRTSVKRCSKCGNFSKLAQSFPPSRLDAWCDDCFGKTPAIERTRKCSIGERRKLKEKQETEAQKRADFMAQSLSQKKAREEERAKNKKSAPKKSKKKTVEDAYSLFNPEESSTADDVEEEKPHDAQAEDRTIFDEDGEKDDD